MKKVLLVLALVVAYGVSTSNATTKVNVVEKATVTVVADDANDLPQDDKKKACKEAKKACCGDKATAQKATVKTEKPSAGCSDAQKKSCAASGKTCGGEKTASTAKKACCGDKKK